MTESSKENVKNHQEYSRNKVAAKSKEPSHRKLVSTDTATTELTRMYYVDPRVFLL
jgi:hypothetical protein